MRYYRTVAPTSPVLTLADLKAHLRIDTADEDGLITSYERGAVDLIERATGQALVNQTWLATFDGFPARFDLPVAPVQSVTSIAYDPPDGAAVTLAPADYRVIGLADPVGAVIEPVVPWPQTRTGGGSVRVTFVAGYGANGISVPESLKDAVRLTVSYRHKMRDLGVVVSGDIRELPFGVADILRDWRRWTF
jgi:uncharacterized phiE125 gp8 family phage protein